LICGFTGQKLHAKAEDDSDSLVDPPKVEEKLGAVPNGLSTDSDVVKRFTLSFLPPVFCITSIFSTLLLMDFIHLSV